MAMNLKYDMPGNKELANGSGDAIANVGGTTMALTDAAGLFTADMVGGQVVVSGATDPDHDGTFEIIGYVDPTTITYTNYKSPATENPFSGSWSVNQLLPGGCLLAYDAAEVEDDELMLSGPAPGGPPGSWPNPGPNDVWSGPYGPEMVDWNNTSHPGAYGAGWSPPNQSLKYDSAIPAGWYTRVSRRDKYSRRDQEVVTINDPII